ncbi:AT-rich interactive domain-containing protein 1-like isoform X1 [Pyrus communis]|uniref:AT-rich interactive domain-containing protein 1-like isoform X1 n=3 Tax=Pyrus communis TaxID=23211 RepID=UPI0035C0EFE7
MQKNPLKNTTPVLGLNSESMAGWSWVAGESALDCAETPKEDRTDDSSADLELPPKAPKRFVLDVPDKLRCWFDQFLGVFLKEISAQDLLRPLPPMIGNGQRVDLLKLFWIVRRRGGFRGLSETGVWDSVAEECDLGLSLGCAVKLVYVKYLYLLERVIEKKDFEWSLASSDIDLGEHLMALQDEFTEFFSDMPDRKLKDGGYPNVELSSKSFKDSNEVGSAVANSDRLKKSGVSDEFLDLDTRNVANVLNAGKFGNGNVLLSGGGMSCLVVDLTNSMEDVDKLRDNDEVKSEMGESSGGMKNDDVDEHVMILDPSTVEEVNSFRKRKRELGGSEAGELLRGKKNDSSDEHVTFLDASTVEEASPFCEKEQESLCRMLNWVRMIAKDPCDPSVGSLPERSRWKSFGKEENWVQVLQAREAIFLKRHTDSGPEQSNWQKNQRMHPSMYDDSFGSAYNLRERLRLEKKLLSGGRTSQSGACSESSSASDLDKNSPGMAGMEDQLRGTSDYSPSHILLGSNYQAQLPEWTGKASESESKWLGSRIWPLEKPEHRYLIERDPIGKGRQESCGCQVPGSIECVRFHISEKRLRVKRELGAAFYHWQFNQMGEEVGLPWTEAEGKKFEAIVKSNPSSLGLRFWDEIYKSFTKKSRRQLVSYYFNVFLLQRRGYQNRFTPNNIDSDDEDLESESMTNDFGNEEHMSSKSILKSPHKPHAKHR